MNRTIERLWLVTAWLVVAALAGCASPARIEQMQVDTSLAQRTAAASSPLAGKVAVKDVTGGSSTNPLWMSKISSSDFERALESSLGAAGLLAAVRPAGPYQLTADLIAVDQPFVGLDMTVTVTVTYRLVDRASGKTVYEETIATPHTATVSDAFLGMERLRLANEGAMRANISRLIEKLIALKLPSP
jgi:uncharacterized lipoprotein YbaY